MLLVKNEVQVATGASLMLA
jgi:hypothetical protein